MARVANVALPFAHTIARVCELYGLGETTVWKLIAEGRLEVIRLKGVRRTLVTHASLMRLFSPEPDSTPARRTPGRPRKLAG
jgi:hypothetical protein